MVNVGQGGSVEPAAPAPQLVVIGSSAGGIEALSVVLATLPPDFPAPIVIAQHVDPNRASHLGQILARRSTLPVVTVDDHEALHPGVVYVIPADRHVRITDHALQLSADSGERPKPSINLLFTSAAQVYSEQLTAVILTGTGSDGAQGAREVKQAGGTVIVQNPRTARFPGMPESIAPTTVDLVADLNEIGPLLTSLLTGAFQLNDQAHDGELRQFLQHLQEQQGIDFTSYKRPTIVRRLQRRIVATSSKSVDGYRQYLEGHPDEYERLVSSFLIKVTEFFRDQQLFTALRQRVLPALLEEARQRENTLRVWSSGCATGEEPYSLAILLSELMGEERDRFHIRVFATDLDSEAIAFARRARYSTMALSSVPPELRQRYFNPVDGVYEIRKDIRGMVVFGEHDVAQRAPFPHVDMVVCRNMLIYFTPELQRRALSLFAYSLRNGGFLVLGKSESARPVPEFFDTEDSRLKIFRRTGDFSVPMTAERFTNGFPTPRLPNTRDSARMIERLRGQRDTAKATSDSMGRLITNLPTGLVVVDRRYSIQSLSTHAIELLGIRSPAIGEDLVHLTRAVPETIVRQIIDEVFRTGKPTERQVIAGQDLASGRPLYLQLSAYPHQRGDDEAVLSVMLLAEDVTSVAGQLRQLEERVESQDREIQQRSMEMARLTEANRDLQDGNLEITKLLADLRVANEEYAVSNEEYQAAMEEVETLNEEVQASNEELETMNEELQATVEELNTTNSDLEARGTELQAVATESEQQRQGAESARQRLEAVLTHIVDAVLVVDAAAKPVLINPAYEHAFGTIGADESNFVAEGNDGKPLPAADQPLQRAARGEAFRMDFTVTQEGGERRWFEAGAAPLSDARDEEARSVLIIRDISDRSLRRLQDEFLGIASHELRTPLTTVLGYLQLLIKTPNNPAKVSELSELAVAGARRLQALVDDLIEPVRLQTGKLRLNMQDIDLAQLTARVAALMGPLSPKQTIRLDNGTDPLMVKGDSLRLEQVLQNLVTNAYKYAPMTDYIDVTLQRRDGHAELRVRDYGPGVDPDEVPRLFSRFYQAEHRERGNGLGLGLYIARELVVAHGGTISVEPTAGQGTTMLVRLPVLQGDKAPAEGQPSNGSRGFT